MIVIGVEFAYIKSMLPGMVFLSPILAINIFYNSWLPESLYFAYGKRQLDMFKSSLN